MICFFFFVNDVIIVITVHLQTFEPFQFKEYIRSNLQLAKWACADHLPSFEEYLYVGGLEVAVDLTVACILMAMENICKEEAFEWLKSRDKLLRAMSTKARVPNDMFGYKVS